MDSATTGTTVVLCVDEPKANMLEMLRLIESTQAQVYNAIAVPPEMMRVLDDIPTAEKIRCNMAEAMPRLLGMQVVVNNLLSNMPARVHRKRRWMSWVYHHRIQKKWNKRFGVGPVAVLMNTDAFLLPQSSGS